MKVRLLIGAALAVAVAGIAIWYWGGSPQDTEEPAKRRLAQGRAKALPSQRPADAVRAAMTGMNTKSGAKRGGAAARPPVDIFAHLSGKDKKLAEEMQSALDADDQKATFAATVKALSSSNAEVRLNAVEALGWFGVEALPELTGLMADPDEDVANAAENQWEQALGEIDDASRRFSIAAAAMSTLSNKDHLTTISGQLEGAALEAINGVDDPEKSAEVRIAVVQALVDIMDSGRENCAEQAKDAYETITGFKWISIDEAEAYLADPDNYDIP